MDDLEKTNLYTTQLHGEELDFIYNQDLSDFENEIFKDKHSINYEIKIWLHLLRKKFRKIIKDKKNKNLINILYITLDTPLEYITEMRNHYPNYDIRLLIPLINIEQNNITDKRIAIEYAGKQIILEKTSITFDFFLQNRIQSASIYKFIEKNTNIVIYGIYSPAYSGIKNLSDLSKLKFLAPFLKSVRIATKKLAKDEFIPEIAHCENIPYYLGGEFETLFPTRTKVLQVVKDFTQVEMTKPEAFWAAINLADKKSMKKICRDEIIKKSVAKLFNLHNTKRFYQMKDCLDFIYKNYYKFRKFIDKGDEIDENIIFNRLNARIMRLFPNLSNGEDLYYNSMTCTLKKCDFWVTVSKTYYNEIFDKPELSGKMYQQIKKTKNKSDYISIGCKSKLFPKEDTRLIYSCFNIENYREYRSKNKTMLLKEFSSDRIKTNFVDPTLFNCDEVKIFGSLDSFYDAPLIFAHTNAEIFANGIDILFNTILKLFELHKNFQVIICINNGIKNSYIKNWVDFLSQNKYLNGRWIFIDGEINLPKFLASSDMIFIPRRINLANNEHLIAMNYGCIPIISRSGILNDSISDIFDDIANGCGFKTKKELLTDDDNNELFLTPVLKALNLYQNNPNSWNLLIKNCLNKNINWSLNTLSKYDQIYQNLL
jgi:hypothetical protein